MEHFVSLFASAKKNGSIDAWNVYMLNETFSVSHTKNEQRQMLLAKCCHSLGVRLRTNGVREVTESRRTGGKKMWDRENCKLIHVTAFQHTLSKMLLDLINRAVLFWLTEIQYMRVRVRLSPFFVIYINCHTPPILMQCSRYSLFVSHILLLNIYLSAIESVTRGKNQMFWKQYFV